MDFFDRKSEISNVLSVHSEPTFLNERTANRLVTAFFEFRKSICSGIFQLLSMYIFILENEVPPIFADSSCSKTWAGLPTALDEQKVLQVNWRKWRKI